MTYSAIEPVDKNRALSGQDDDGIDARVVPLSEAEEIRDEWRRAEARKLGPVALRWYRFLSFWRLGNLETVDRTIYLHDLALEIEREDRKLKNALMGEYRLYGHLLVDNLAHLGFSHIERLNGRRRFTRRIRIDRGVITPTVFYYRVQTAKRTATGGKTMLPYKTNAADLLEDKTAEHLSIALNRRVESEYRPRKGLWYKVHTTEDMGALPRRVSFWAIEKHMTPGRQELILGVGANRTVHILDLDKRPHLLLAGTTGAGKSNSLNTMICMLIRMNEPEQLRMILIDLKNGVEFEDYEDIPHLAVQVVTTQREARDRLAQALALIKQRYLQMRLLPKPRPKTITAYNARVEPAKRVPRLVVIVDELGELLIGGDEKLQREIERLFIRIAQLGRAAGVHLILSTQRPQKEIVTTAISAQMTAKMSHMMSTNADSMTVFGSGEAAHLDPIPGRAVYKIGWKPYTVQPPVATAEVVGACTARAKSMPPAWFVLPDLEMADRLIKDDTDALPDYEGQLITMLTEAGGNLSLQLIGQVLNINRGQAQLWLNRVADLTFEYDGKMYAPVQVGRSYRIQECQDDEQDEQVIEAPATSAPEKWRVNR